MNPRLSQVLQFVFFLAVGVILLYIAFKGMDFDDIGQKFKDADYRWVWLSLVFGLCSHIFRACRWRLMGEPIGHVPSFFHTFCAVMVGYLANYAFPRLGEVVRCAVLRKTDKMPFEKLIGTVVVERAVDLFIVCFLLALLLIFRFDFFGQFLTANVFVPIQQAVVKNQYLIAIAILGLLAIIAGMIWLFRKSNTASSQWVWLQKIKQLFQGVKEGLMSVFAMRKRFQFVLFSVLIWVAYFLQTYLVFFAIPATSALSPIDGVFILVMSSVGFIIPVQGGIGTFHWAVSLALLLYGIPRADGLVYATISHTSGSLLTILLGFICLACVGAIGSEVRKKE